VGWDEVVTINGDDDDDDDGPPVMLPFNEAMAQVEAILLDSSATKEDLVRAKDIAESINELDEDTPACDNDDDGEDEEDDDDA